MKFSPAHAADRAFITINGQRVADITNVEVKLNDEEKYIHKRMARTTYGREPKSYAYQLCNPKNRVDRLSDTANGNTYSIKNTKRLWRLVTCPTCLALNPKRYKGTIECTIR